jgi:hypothetical protein
MGADHLHTYSFGLCETQKAFENCRVSRAAQNLCFSGLGLLQRVTKVASLFGKSTLRSASMENYNAAATLVGRAHPMAA